MKKIIIATLSVIILPTVAYARVQECSFETMKPHIEKYIEKTLAEYDWDKNLEEVRQNQSWFDRNVVRNISDTEDVKKDIPLIDSVSVSDQFFNRPETLCTGSRAGNCHFFKTREFSDEGNAYWDALNTKVSRAEGKPFAMPVTIKFNTSSGHNSFFHSEAIFDAMAAFILKPVVVHYSENSISKKLCVTALMTGKINGLDNEVYVQYRNQLVEKSDWDKYFSRVIRQPYRLVARRDFIVSWTPWENFEFNDFVILEMGK